LFSIFLFDLLILDIPSLAVDSFFLSKLENLSLREKDIIIEQFEMIVRKTVKLTKISEPLTMNTISMYHYFILFIVQLRMMFLKK